MLYINFEAEEPRQILYDRRPAIGLRMCTRKYLSQNLLAEPTRNTTL